MLSRRERERERKIIERVREEGREGKAIFEITDGNGGDDLCVGFVVAVFFASTPKIFFFPLFKNELVVVSTFFYHR